MADIKTDDPEVYVKLKFGMSREELKELERQEKERRKKLAKGWRPEGH
jgi:hypothetical protein